MEVFPVINCPDLASARRRVETGKTFLSDGHFFHLDVTDGAFTFHKTWANPTEWANLRAPFNLEVHLMVEQPEKYIEPWLAAGAKRFIIHIETIDESSLKKILQKCGKRRAEVMLSLNPETPVKKMEPYFAHCSRFQVLAVHPGPAGQKFLPLTLEKVRFLRRKLPGAIIEVDGGIAPATARRAHAAGADIVVSGAYIFESGDPEKAYDELVNLRLPRSKWYHGSFRSPSRAERAAGHVSFYPMQSLTEKKLQELALTANRLRADIIKMV